MFELLNWNEIVSCFLLLFTIIDMIGNSAIIIPLSKKNPINPATIAITSGCIFIGFLFLGQSMLKLLEVDIKAFAVAGSIVLFIIALELILGIEIHKEAQGAKGSIVPIAFPLIAGPGSLTMILSLKSEYAPINIIIGILLNVLIIYLVIRFTGVVGKFFTPGILAVIKKIFGIILLAISIKLFGSNILSIFSI